MSNIFKMGIAATTIVIAVIAGMPQSRAQEPKPLSTHEIIKVGIPAKLKQNLNLFLADQLGEFAKENISIEYVFQRPADGLVLLITNRIDVLATQASAAYFNAVASGADIKMVYPSAYWAPEGKSGFWVSKAFLNGRKYSPELMKGQTIASTAGAGTMISHYVEMELNKVGLSQPDVNWKSMNIGDILIALENGAVNFGVLIEPFTEKADLNKVQFAFAAGDPKEGIAGSYNFGPRLLEERRDIGAAFIRAMARTKHSYLNGDFRKNPKVVAVMAKELGVSEDDIRNGSRLITDDTLNFNSHMAAIVQKTYALTPGLLSYQTPLPESRVFDRSFAEAAEKSRSKK